MILARNSFVSCHRTVQLKKKVLCVLVFILYFRNRLSYDIVILAKKKKQDDRLSNNYFIF